RVLRQDARLQSLDVRAATLDRLHMLALACDRERQAGVFRDAVDEHGAGAAIAAVAHLLCAGETEVVAQGIEERAARLGQEEARLAIHIELDRGRTRAAV